MNESGDARFFDAERLVAHAAALQELTTRPDGAVRLHVGLAPPDGARLGLLAGSFNPPTVAHLTLARAGLRVDRLDAVWYALSTRTVDKEVISGAGLEDRLLMLDLLVEDDDRLGVLLLNRGLYVDQARLLRAAYPRLGEIVFLVGFDKIVQIFDPRYYPDRDAALAELFALATFLVAPRGADEAPALAALLDRPENRRFAGAVRPLDLPAHLRGVASSSIRDDLADGAESGTEAGAASPAGPEDPATAMPPPVARFVAATGLYRDGDRYARRRATIAEAVASADATPAALGVFAERLRSL